MDVFVDLWPYFHFFRHFYSVLLTLRQGYNIVVTLLLMADDGRGHLLEKAYM